MNPALIQAALMQQQGVSQPNPISSGSLAAINSVKQSLGMDEDEKRRALGLGIMAFSSGLAKPGYGQGVAGTLNAINSSMNPAINAYLGEQQRVEQQNANILKMAMDAENENKRRDFQERQFEEMKRHHNITADKYRKESQALRDWESTQEEHPGAIPYSSMSKNDQAFYTKQDEQRLNAPISFKKAVNILDEMTDIVEKNPNLSTSWTSWLGGESVPAKVFSNPKDRIANEKMNMLSNQLVLMKAEAGVGGAKVGQFIEQIMAKSKPNAGLTKETIKYSRDLARHELKELEEDRNLVKKGRMGKKGIGRIHIPAEYAPYEEPQQPSNQSFSGQTITLQSPDGQTINIGGDITAEKLLQLEQKGFKRIDNE